MDNNLHFIETMTVEQFKAAQRVENLTLKQASGSSKIFFQYGGRTGAVSTNGVPQKPMVSLVHPTLEREPSAEELAYVGKNVMGADGHMTSDPRANGFFYLCHEEGTGGATVLATF